MLIEVYADVVDANAYVLKRRLASAVATLREQGHHPTVTWQPYLTDPTAPRSSVPADDLSGNPIFDAWQAFPKATPEAEPVFKDSIMGFGRSLDARWRASSWAAHRILGAALEISPQRQDEVLEALLQAHFVDGTDINSVGFLREIVQRFELTVDVPSPNGEHALVYMEPGFAPDDPAERRTREAKLTGTALGIDFSPTLLVNGHSPLEGAQSAEVLVRHITAAAAEPARELPDVVRRLRLATKLLDEARDPLGSLYLLHPLRPEYDGERTLETLTARALVASASLRPARDKLTKLVEQYPDDAHLHHLLGRTLRRLGDNETAHRHLTIAAAMNPEYADY